MTRSFPSIWFFGEKQGLRNQRIVGREAFVVREIVSTAGSTIIGSNFEGIDVSVAVFGWSVYVRAWETKGRG